MEKPVKYQTKNSETSYINKEKENILECFARIKKAFPELSSGWFEELNLAIKRNNINSEELTDAVNNLIDNYRYQRPTIAEVINFRKKKYYTYEQIIKEFGELDDKWSYDKEKKLFYKD